MGPEQTGRRAVRSGRRRVLVTTRSLCRSPFDALSDELGPPPVPSSTATGDRSGGRGVVPPLTTLPASVAFVGDALVAPRGSS
ncbi:hypothetical protein MINT15_36090 [Saccharomonospora viridis]|uniref:Uncharacterized protein n=1 Tax=Saccharomonospora viridis TaxID=1852 RepID=A0A837D6Y0_9PSEU|nr:hypothetical protein MINT15_36090 [Saccharomonospora viridis]